MEPSLHGELTVRRRRRVRLRRLIPRPAGALFAFAAVFGLGRLTARPPVPQVLDTPAVREAAEIDRTLADLEAKLEQGAQWVQQNSELKRRHERVSALACTAAEAQHDDAVRIVREKAARHQQSLKQSQDEDAPPEHADASPSESLAGHVLAQRHTGEPVRAAEFSLDRRSSVP